MEYVLDLVLYIVNPDKQFSIWLSQYTTGMSFWGFYALLIMHHGTWLLGKYSFAHSIVVSVRKRKMQTHQTSIRAERVPRSRFARWTRNVMATLQRSTKGKRFSKLGMVLIGIEPYCQKFGIALVILKPELYSWPDLVALWIGGSLSLALDAAVLAWLGRDAKWYMYGFMIALGIFLLYKWLRKKDNHSK